MKLPNTFDTPQLQEAKAPTIPIICVPTSLLGVKYSNAAGATDDLEDKKYQFIAPLRGPPLRGPPLVILDEHLARSVPKISSYLQGLEQSTAALRLLRHWKAALFPMRMPLWGRKPLFRAFEAQLGA